MSGAAAYILTITAAAILVSIVRQLAGGVIVRLISGVFMALVILAPVLKVELPDPEKWIREFQFDAQAAVSAGEVMAEEASHEIIMAQTRAYILDKAASLGATLDADVKLDDTGIPVSITLRGDVSPAVKSHLTQWMWEELGIKEEMQHWSE